MAISYTWSFGPLETKPQENNLTDVVKVVHWRYSAQDGNYSSSIYGTVSLDAPETNTFTSFTSLTKTKVKNWVLNKLDKTEAELKTQLSDQITKQKTPEMISKTAPWE